MQKGFIRFYLLIFLSIITFNNFLFSLNNENYFFNHANFIISELELLQNKNLDNCDDNNLKSCFLFDLKESLNKVDNCNLKFITSSELISLFNFIENKSKKVLETKTDLQYNDLDKIKKFFSFLKNGIYYQLSLEHILEFKIFAMNSLNEIIDLIDYWSFKLKHKGIQDRIEKVFKKRDSDIKSKLESLFYLKRRISIFLGKADELISRSIDLENEANDKLLFDLNKDIVFCINSFFSQNYIPETLDYDENLKLFSVNFDEKSFRKFLSNHKNILLLKSGSKFLLKDYQSPYFFKRNWLKLSFFTIGGVVTTVYVYNDWNGIKTRSNAIFNYIKDSYSTFIGMVNEKFDFHIPGGVAQDSVGNSIGLHDAVENSMERLRELANSLEDSGEQVFARYSLGDSLEDSDETAWSSEESLEDSVIGIATEQMLDSMSNVRGKIDDSIKKIGTQGEGLAEQLDGLTESLNKTAAILGIVDSEEVPSILERRKISIGTVGNFLLPDRVTENIESFLSKIDLLQRRLDSLSDIKADDTIRKSLEDLILQLSEIIRSVSAGIPLCNEYLSDYEGLIHSSVGIILNTIQNIVLVASDTIDQKIGKVRVMANWIKATVSVLLTSIILPLSIAFIVRKVLRNKRRVKVNNVLVNLHKILNINNKVNQDVYMNDISYYDRGQLAFFVNSLELKVTKLFKTDKGRLYNLIQDLKNYNYTIGQKLEFIKTAWSYNLFETNSGVSDTLIENSFGV